MSRGIEQRIDWFLSHNPSAYGMCLNHTWLATDLPPAGCEDANAALDYIKAHGKLEPIKGEVPRGAWVLWRSSTYGHAALSLGEGKIASTDVKGPATVGKVALSYPETHWGFNPPAGYSSWYGEHFQIDEGGDVALTEDDIERIAKKIWNHQIPEQADSKQEQPAKVFLRQAWARAGKAAEQEKP